jgi:HK97 gp10 family phage protein
MKSAGAVRVEGIEETVAALRAVNDVFAVDKVKTVLMRVAVRVRDRAKALCRVGTGITKQNVGNGMVFWKQREHLRDLIFAAYGKRNDPSVIAGVDLKKAPHAHLVEFGHGGPHPAPAYPYMRPAAHATTPEVETIAGEGFKRLLAPLEKR